ncbi:hypothetical protein Y032_0039g150 [Ancylostoma ceylanicum]|uniref:Uncharacterized protein n=1 Tax=Ancylostoma ceylanicum TaxID=53326 RepID=A0A016UHX7_9BILA|nr:hypothetical protein Y032_0039g150 [Ancylostoma ceylanicum]
MLYTNCNFWISLQNCQNPLSSPHRPYGRPQLDPTISTVYTFAKHPNVFEQMKPFVGTVHCEEAIASDRFRMTALNERLCDVVCELTNT